MVREAAVDLVGKFILHREELIDKYYVMLSERIMVRFKYCIGNCILFLEICQYYVLLF